MAKCRKYLDYRCPELYEVKSADEVSASGKPLDQYCYYCMATPKMKKIGHRASWIGDAPKWCPLGRDEEGES